MNPALMRLEFVTIEDKCRKSKALQLCRAFDMHAQTLVLDSQILYIVSYNFDPCPENLNTEVGVIKASYNQLHKTESYSLLLLTITL